jgi:hypothetical protein
VHDDDRTVRAPHQAERDTSEKGSGDERTLSRSYHYGVSAQLVRLDGDLSWDRAAGGILQHSPGFQPMSPQLLDGTSDERNGLFPSLEIAASATPELVPLSDMEHPDFCAEEA